MKIAYATNRVPRLLLPAVAVAVLTVAALAVAGCSVSTGGSSSSGSASPGSSGQASGRSYSMPAQVHTLKVSNRVGSIKVTATTGSSQIRVTEQPTGKPTARHSSAGSTGTVSASCPDSTDNCRMAYKITMPASDSLNVTGALGEVTLQGGPSKAQIKTDAGKVSGSGLRRGSYTVNTQAGEVDLAFAGAPSLVRVNTSAGEIKVAVPGSAAYRVSASSDVGDTDVTVPSKSSAANKIDLHADFGHVALHKGS